MCHILNLSKVTVEFEYIEETCEIEDGVRRRRSGRPGVEMEALTGVQVALLTIYDMCKAVEQRHVHDRYPFIEKNRWKKRHMGS